MRTTISQTGDRCGGVQSERDQEQIIADARAILADVSDFLKGRIAVLKTTKTIEADQREIDDLTKLIREAQSSLQLVLKMESSIAPGARLATALDLEAARAEIESRLNRLVALGAT